MGGQRGDGGLLGLVLPHQCGEGLTAQQGSVTVGDHHGALAEASRLDRDAHGVTRTPLPVLDDGPGIGRVRGEMAENLAAAMAHHDDELGRAQLPRGGKHVIEHGRAADRVQDFGDSRLHPRARPRGQDDYGAKTAHSHLAGLLVLLPDWLVSPLPAHDPLPAYGR